MTASYGYARVSTGGVALMPTRLDVGDLVRRGEIALGFEETSK